jgi:GH43 family beta-xylosidase
MRECRRWAAAVLLAAAVAGGRGWSQNAAQAGSIPAGKFTNPIKDNGADPWVYVYKGMYYYMNTPGHNIQLWATRDITDLKDAEHKVLWTPEAGKAWSKGIWAPEMIRWGDTWFIYFAADKNGNETHRVYALENSSDDPMKGDWVFKGQVADRTDKWAIDQDVFEVKGQHYMVWSGWEGDTNGVQRIYIAHMSNGYTIDSPRTEISEPTYEWEKHSGQVPVLVNEGPEGLVHGDKVFVVFSASGCWTDDYELGAVEASTNADLLKAKSWKKIDHPLLTKDPEHGVYGPGHNGFFQSPDGTNWIIYHANPESGQGCGGHRSPRIQPFTWNADGTPDFGRPVAPGVLLDKPK